MGNPINQLPAMYQVEYIYYPVLALVGVSVNLMAIVILMRGRCGLSKCITHYLMAMAVSDLFVVITDVILKRIRSFYFPMSFLAFTPVCSLNTIFRYSATDISVWLTVMFTFDRFVAVCYQKLKTRYCTEGTAAVVITAIYLICILKNIPWFFKYEPLRIINNVPWECKPKASFYTLPAWVALDWIDRILTPFIPFILILALNTLTVSHILIANTARRRLRNQSNSDTDSELENRQKSIILLFSVSGSLILLWMPSVMHFLYYQITNAYQYSGYQDPAFIAKQTGTALLLLSSCTNTCIYVVTQTKFRQELRYIVTYPCTRFTK